MIRFALLLLMSFPVSSQAVAAVKWRYICFAEGWDSGQRRTVTFVADVYKCN